MTMNLDQMIRGAIASTTERGSGAAARRVPQVSLMPAEIRGVAHVRRVRIALVAGVLAVAAVTAGATITATTAAADADARAAASQQRLTAAAAQLAKFKDVQTLQQQIALDTAARRVGSSTAIDWQRWLGLLEADMPFGFRITSVQADSATPFGDYEQGTTPLENPRAATVQIAADTASIDQLPVWLRKLKSLSAYADATPLVSKSDAGYSVQVTIHLTTGAYVTPLKGNG